MSIEFRLKYIQEVIDKNVNDVLLKWNAKKVFLDEPFDEDTEDTVCSACLKAGEKRFLRYSYVNIDEAVYKCESSNCLFPYRNFKYKNFADRTIFRYERDNLTKVSNSEQKPMTSPAKLESENVDGFNLSWLDYSLESDLDNILDVASPDKQTCDIKEIIDDLCNSVQDPSTDDYFEDNSQIGMNSFHNGLSPKLPTRRLSKCLKYIEHLSPPKQTSPKKTEVPLTPFLTESNPIFKVPVSPAKSITRKMVNNGLKKDRKVVKKKHDTKAKPLIDQQSLGLFDWLDAYKNIEPKELEKIQSATSVKNGNSQLYKMPEKTPEPIQSLPILIEFNSSQSPNESVYYDPSTSYNVELKIDNIPTTPDECKIGPMTNLTVPITSYVPGDILSMEQPSTVNNIQPSELITIPTASECSSELSSEHSQKSVKKKCEKSQNKPKVEAKGKDSGIGKQPTEKQLMKRKLLQEFKQKLKAKTIKPKKIKSKMNSGTEVVKVTAKRKNFCIEEEQFVGFEPLEPFKPFVLKKSPLIWIKSE